MNKFLIAFVVADNMRSERISRLKQVHFQLAQCRQCQTVCGEAVHGPAIDTQVMIVGQAPGAHESHLGRPFAYKAGKTLFKWLFEATGLDEETIRAHVYFTAVARCFPGKIKGAAGDRAPNRQEIENCEPYLRAEILALKPKLILAVGRLAIERTLPDFHKGDPLANVVGQVFTSQPYGVRTEVLPLPHPSGVSRWPQTEPGRTLLKQALQQIAQRFELLQV